MIRSVSVLLSNNKMVKALDNSLVDLEVMPGSKQDEFREGNQQGNQR